MKHRRATAISKIPILAAMGAMVLFCGCSTPSSSSFTAYHGSEVFQGKGGDEDDVDGIEIWQNGEPDRKYRILGVVAEPHHGHHMGRLSSLFGGGGDRGSAIAKIAHNHGGDAVIVVVKEQPTEDSDSDDFESSHHHRQATLVIVKYVK